LTFLPKTLKNSTGYTIYGSATAVSRDNEPPTLALSA
jgi:hypothetical protein